MKDLWEATIPASPPVFYLQVEARCNHNPIGCSTQQANKRNTTTRRWNDQPPRPRSVVTLDVGPA